MYIDVLGELLGILKEEDADDFYEDGECSNSFTVIERDTKNSGVIVRANRSGFK
jgi:hypothetical protein